LQKPLPAKSSWKRWSRAKKLTLIERINPAWVELSKDWFEYEPADFKRDKDRILS